MPFESLSTPCGSLLNIFTRRRNLFTKSILAVSPVGRLRSLCSTRSVSSLHFWSFSSSCNISANTFFISRAPASSLRLSILLIISVSPLPCLYGLTSLNFIKRNKMNKSPASPSPQIHTSFTLDPSPSHRHSEETTFRRTPRSTRSLLILPSSRKYSDESSFAFDTETPTSGSRYKPGVLLCCPVAQRGFSCVSLRSAVMLYALFDIASALIHVMSETTNKVLFSNYSTHA